MNDIVRIGNATLILGDCRDFLPTLVNWPEDVTRQLLSLGEVSQASRLRLVQ